MKKSNKKDIKQLQPARLNTSAAIDEARLLKRMVENLAHRRIDHECSHELMPAGQKAVVTSSLEAFVSGNLNVSREDYPVNIPFISCFLFTCTRALGEDYSLSWSSSLS